jgi:hypothetical protein
MASGHGQRSFRIPVRWARHFTSGTGTDVHFGRNGPIVLLHSSPNNDKRLNRPLPQLDHCRAPWLPGGRGAPLPRPTRLLPAGGVQYHEYRIGSHTWRFTCPAARPSTTHARRPALRPPMASAFCHLKPKSSEFRAAWRTQLAIDGR